MPDNILRLGMLSWSMEGKQLIELSSGSSQFQIQYLGDNEIWENIPHKPIFDQHVAILAKEHLSKSIAFGGNCSLRILRIRIDVVED